jgi:hypothetical protein
VTRRLPHLALVLIALAVTLAPAALAGTPKKHHKRPSNCVSAVCVYHEQQEGPSGSNSIGSTHGAVPLSARAARELAKLGGKDRRLLAYLATRQAVQPVPGANVGHVSSPGTFLAALDLGAGPIALFATLLAGATAFGLGNVLRRRRTTRA